MNLSATAKQALDKFNTLLDRAAHHPVMDKIDHGLLMLKPEKIKAGISGLAEKISNNVRPGNVQDSNGADKFMMQCFEELQQKLKGTTFESRMDSAFFSQTVLTIIGVNHVKLSPRFHLKDLPN